MRRLLPLVMILMAAPAANAGGLVHKMSSSVQLTVDSARTTATRLGSQYSISGSNVNTTDGTTVCRNYFCWNFVQWHLCSWYNLCNNSLLQLLPGEAFSFSTSYIQGDAVPTIQYHCHLYSSPSPSVVSINSLSIHPTFSASVGAVGNFSSQTSYAAGTAGDLAGTIATDGGIITMHHGGIPLVPSYISVIH